MPGSISVAMIVKDEADHLAECLSSIRSLASEICIVDTGSRDNTLEIARENGARISVFLWCDDFSAARNESLRLCTRDWVFVIDADERIAPQDLATLRALANGPADCCYRITTRNYTNTTTVEGFTPVAPGEPMARGFAGWYPSTKVRLFPSGRGGRFEGKVHELVNPSLERNGVRILDCVVPVHHYPLLKSAERVREKQELYLQLGKDKVSSSPTDPKAYVELGNQYSEIRDYVRAVAAYREALRLAPYSPLILRDLGGVLHLMGRSEEAKHALRLAIQLDPTTPAPWRNLGVVYADEKEWGAAVECFEKALALDPAWKDGQRYLSVALEGAGRLPEAAERSRKALQSEPNSKECLKLFIHQMLRLERRDLARSVLGKVIREGADNPDLHNAMGELCYYDNLYEESETHFVAAGKSGSSSAFNNLGVLYFKQGRFEEARKAFERCMETDPGHKGARANLDRVLKRLEKS